MGAPHTNSAAERIQSLLKAHYSVIPIRIKVSTIHSFLYQEFIKPYYYILFHKQYEKIINIKLPSKPSFRNFRIAEMEDKDILVVDVIPERAKWVIAKKSDDKKREKDIRELIQSAFSSYCGAMFVDEAQDIEKHFYEIIRMMELMNIPIELMGDPKQDLRGYNYLRKLTDEYPENVESICECHRCPQKHLGLSNSFIRATEKQESCKKKGDINVIFESECSIQQLIEDAHFDLVYISHKNDRFETHQNKLETSQFDILYIALTQVFSHKFSTYSIEKIERFAYIKTENLLNAYKESNDPKKAMSTTFSKCHLEKLDYVKIIQLLQQTNDIDGEKILVSSIDCIKGREGYNCLFILTTDLADYFFQKKTEENKIKNKLYVALTRSLRDMSILITLEVEEKFGHDFIDRYIEALIKCRS